MIIMDGFLLGWATTFFLRNKLFIPFCDHRVPPDVPLSNYIHYLKQAKRVWGLGLEDLAPTGEPDWANFQLPSPSLVPRQLPPLHLPPPRHDPQYPPLQLIRRLACDSRDN